MHVVHVASGRLFGGIEQMLVTMARCRTAAANLDATFAIAAPGRLEQELRAVGADVEVVGDVRLSRPASIVHARSKLRALLNRGRGRRDSTVICHAPWALALFGSVARRRHLPLVLWQHDHASGGTLVERWARGTRTDLVICNSAWTSKSAQALQPGVPTVVIHPPVAIADCPAATRADVRRTLRAGDNDVVILSASRLEPWKGHLNLLRALGRVRAGAWTWWIAGGAQRPHEQQHETALRAEVSKLGLDRRVRFLGERRDVPMLMKAADLVCQPNEGPEPFGIVFAEALLSGVPAVTADIGGAPEIVSESCGRLVPPGDSDALARALDEVIRDRALRERLGANGPAHAAARVAPDVVLPQLARALASIGATAAA